MESILSWLWVQLLSLWRFVSDSKYDTFWSAMTAIVTFLGLGFIYLQVRHGVKSTDINLLFALYDRFWSDDMVEVRKKIKTRENIEWLAKLKSGQITADCIRVYSPEHIPRFTIFDFFESIGALYRRDRRLLRFIYPLMGGDIIFHYKLHEHFYNHINVKPLYPQQNFKYLAEACIKEMKKNKVNEPTFDELVKNI